MREFGKVLFRVFAINTCIVWVTFMSMYSAWHWAYEAKGVIPPEEKPSTSLLVQHGCWSGEAPADMEGKMPGHVVVTMKSGETVYSSELVEAALAHVFEDADNAIYDVHGFCR